MQRNGIDLDELFSDEESEQVARNVECRLEQHDGVWILYRKDNNEFVAQGRNKQELSDAVEKRYPGQSVVATEFADDIKERFQASTD